MCVICAPCVWWSAALCEVMSWQLLTVARLSGLSPVCVPGPRLAQGELELAQLCRALLVRGPGQRHGRHQQPGAHIMRLQLLHNEQKRDIINIFIVDI